MARLNIYLPDDLYQLANKWRHQKNLSEICASALRDELQAAENYRSARNFISAVRPRPQLEKDLCDKYGLLDVVAIDPPANRAELRDALGIRTSAYLDANISRDALLAVGGGRQVWCVVRNLTPKAHKITLTALGMDNVDPRVMHVHPNTLVTLLTLLYGPRTEAHLIGAATFQQLWRYNLPEKDYPKYFVVASCSPLYKDSPFAQLIGKDQVSYLLSQNILGDYAYQFLTADGRVLDVSSTNVECSILQSTMLQGLSQRPDARIILVGGGSDKNEVIHRTLQAKLCNTLITDTATGKYLLTAC